MKKPNIQNKFLICILTLLVLVALPANLAFSEKIVLKDDKVIYGKIKSRSADTIWVNIGPGSVGYNIDEISYIYNDDGSISKYSPKSKEEVIEELQAELIEELCELRHLSLKTKIESDELTSEEVKNFYFKRINEEAPKKYIISEEKILKKLKLVPDDFNYYGTFEKLAREDVGGFYDHRDKKLYISKSIPEEARLFVILHETIHALQDQNFDLDKLRPVRLDDSDLMAARTSLAEGDAMISSYNYMFKAFGQDIKDMPDISSWIKDALELGFKRHEAFAKYSPFLQEQILFPYLQGGSFVHKILQNYSYDKLNEIFKDPPSSTEQILHIEKYLFQKDEPVYITVKSPVTFLSGWENIYTDRWGEYAIYSFLKQHNEILFAKVASGGWGGDNIVGYENAESKKILLIWATIWDTRKDADEFYNAYSVTVSKRYEQAKKLDKLSTHDETFFDCEDKGLVYLGEKDKRVLIAEGIESNAPDELISAIWTNTEIITEPEF